MPPSEVEI